MKTQTEIYADLFRVLKEDDQATIIRWSQLLGIGSDGWQSVQWFYKLIELVAIVSFARNLQEHVVTQGDPAVSDRCAFFESAELLLGDVRDARSAEARLNAMKRCFRRNSTSPGGPL